jgi:hypothetical protein
MTRSDHGDPPAIFMLAFYGVMAVGCGAALKLGWELMARLLA